MGNYIGRRDKITLFCGSLETPIKGRCLAEKHEEWWGPRCLYRGDILKDEHRPCMHGLMPLSARNDKMEGN